jgi:hypothetical protein
MNSIAAIKLAVRDQMDNESFDDFKAFVAKLKTAASTGYAINTKFSLFSYMRTETKKKYGITSDQYKYLTIISRTDDEKKEIDTNESKRISDINNNIKTFTDKEFKKIYDDLIGGDTASKILALMSITGARMIEIISDKYTFTRVDGDYIKQTAAKGTKTVVKPLLRINFNDFNMLLNQIRSTVDQTLTNIQLNSKYASMVKNRLKVLGNALVNKSHALRSIYVAFVVRHFPNVKKSDEQYKIDLLGHIGSGSILNYSTYRNV